MTDASTAPIGPTKGMAVLHLFCKPTPLADAAEVEAAVKRAQADGNQIVPVAILGHKADVAFMAVGNDWRSQRAFQTALQHAGLDVVDSYVSLTELSEYAKGLPEQMANARLHPQLPPEGKPAYCFYPMSKRRNVGANWFALTFEERSELMHEHGTTGRTFAGRILQLITGSTGLDDFEWGVTLFGVHPDDLKDVVYTMRYDRASAQFAEFGPFYTGYVTTLEELTSGW
jgi:hydrogen peroxide-dependent heme synthase